MELYRDEPGRPQPVVLPRPPHTAPPNIELAVAVVMLVIALAMAQLADNLIAIPSRTTPAMAALAPRDLPDLFWLLTGSFGGAGTLAGAVVSTVAPVVMPATVGVLVVLTQSVDTLTSLLSGFTILFLIRAIVMCVTYFPAVWTVRENSCFPEVLGRNRGATVPANAIVVSGHTVNFLFPLLFLALLTTEPGTSERTAALGVAGVVAVVPLLLVISSRIHHSADVFLGAALAALLAFICSERVVGWQGTVPPLIVLTLVLGLNFLVFGGWRSRRPPGHEAAPARRASSG